jgi:hypothetical protein
VQRDTPTAARRHRLRSLSKLRLQEARSSTSSEATPDTTDRAPPAARARAAPPHPPTPHLAPPPYVNVPRRHVWLRSKAVQGGGCIGATDDPSSWDSPLALNSTERWGSGGGGKGASYVAPWEIIFELVRVSRADRVQPPPPHPPAAAQPCHPAPKPLSPSLICRTVLQVSNPFAIDWQLLHDMPAAHKLVASGALLCLFREIFVKSATVRAAVHRALFSVCSSVPPPPPLPPPRRVVR